MERNGEKYIAVGYNVENYLSLKLKPNSEPNDWNTAIDIFETRINGRYFNQINILLGNPTDDDTMETNGFAIMALECLLIETLAQFRYGLKNTSGCSKEKYTLFLTENFGDIFTGDYADCFYSKIRCGILHSAQTEGHSALSTSQDYIVSCVNGEFSVSVLRFSQRIQQYFETYIRDLHDCNNTYLRQNFIRKMNYLCSR